MEIEEGGKKELCKGGYQCGVVGRREGKLGDEGGGVKGNKKGRMGVGVEDTNMINVSLPMIVSISGRNRDEGLFIFVFTKALSVGVFISYLERRKIIILS